MTVTEALKRLTVDFLKKTKKKKQEEKMHQCRFRKECRKRAVTLYESWCYDATITSVTEVYVNVLC